MAQRPDESLTTQTISLTDLQAPVASSLALVQERLTTVIQSAPEVFQPVSDQLLTGGKRLRSLVLLLSSQVDDQPAAAAVPLAVAVEQVHLASLMHDDLLDGAEQRRGQPSAPVALGSRGAVLAGDYLAAAAYQEIVAASVEEAAEVLTQAVLRMTLAEAKATTTTGQLILEDDYLETIQGKTSALFQAAAHLGALAAQAQEQQIQALREYGFCLGLAFQIRDDLLDLYGEAGQVGKPVEHDLAAGVYTLPVIYAAQADREEALPDLLTQLREHPEDTALAQAITELTRSLGGEAYATQRMNEYAQRACAVLPAFSARQQLVDLAQYVISRTA